MPEDAMTLERTEVAEVEVAGAPVSLALLGTTDPMAAIERAVSLADLFMRVLRERQLARRFGDSERDFVELGGWQVLGAEVGVTAIITSTGRLEAGIWEARAEVRTPDGRVVGAADGMCSKDEPNWRRSREHDIRAMAQVRAQRRALQSVLGFIPALAGMDVSDPDAPATRRQIVALYASAGAHGWDHEESHRRAGVESFRFLTRAAAAALIDEWSDMSGTEGGDAPPSSVEPPSAPALTLEDAWARAVEIHGSRVAVLQAHLARWPSDRGVSASSVTIDELLELIGEGALHA